MSSLMNGLSLDHYNNGEKATNINLIDADNNFRGRSPIISVRKTDISPLKTGLGISEENEGVKSNLRNLKEIEASNSNNVDLQGRRNGTQQQTLNNGFTESYYSGSMANHTQFYFQTRNMVINSNEPGPMLNRGFSEEENKNMSCYNMMSNVNKNYNVHYGSNNMTMQNSTNIPKVKMSLNGLNTIVNSNPPSGITDFVDFRGDKYYGANLRELKNTTDYQINQEMQSIIQPGKNNNLERILLGSNQNASNKISHNSLQQNGSGKKANTEENISYNTDFVSVNENNNYPYPERSFYNEQKLNNVCKSFTPNTIFQTNTSANQQFSSINSSNPTQLKINSSNLSPQTRMINHQLLNSVPLLAQIQIESIQDMTSVHNSMNGGIYNSSIDMSYSIVASFNNIDDRNETYRIGPFPCMNTSNNGKQLISCIVQDKISLPFSWSQPNLKIKILEENDFKADIIGSCSIFIDSNSIGIPSQAYLVDPQTNQFRGTLRFILKLVPNQHNPNYRYDQIHGPNSILNRRDANEHSIFDAFRGFCCVD
ncbi:hypothetical protein FG379_000843 [Cryptosporidium bovis]|uniref:uncharacterized protein n=1 Tax=Cryptosporidium bovis TaxID=310047 RepID=UPI00351A190B|nr:hypothetical protein FG379_000843 [Cryptosporidium bovis]